MEDRSRAVVDGDSWRDLILFGLGPAMLAAAIAALYAIHPWPVPYPPQARTFDPLFFGPVLILASLGVWLSSRTGLPSAPSFQNRRGWRRLLIVSTLVGLAMLAISAVFDLGLGLSRVTAQVIGQTSVNVPFPASIAHYAFGAIIEECLARLALLPILTWLIGALLLRGRRRLVVFWVVAAIVSLLEPLGQAMPLAARAPSLALIVGGTESAGNLVVAELFRRFGWPALLVMRLVQELSWHVVWPLVSGAG